MPGTFIDVEVDESIRGDSELAERLEQACPVDIYANRVGRVEVVEENLDECVLCELCVRAAPPGKLRVLKLYDGTCLSA
jgi:NAD-dependent dihydropyrimidine dehydrogenase PreA subunit